MGPHDFRFADLHQWQGPRRPGVLLARRGTRLESSPVEGRPADVEDRAGGDQMRSLKGGGCLRN
ncbi:hypothetical protein GCM10018783_08740 [Streptomyces griseosporeus]|nr:hypothetical protein GCM10018783_08740 [Streptomyces griseosporeus]